MAAGEPKIMTSMILFWLGMEQRVKKEWRHFKNSFETNNVFWRFACFTSSCLLLWSGETLVQYLVTEAPTAPFLSCSTMIRFLDSCSWIRITFSWPFTIKYPPVKKYHMESINHQRKSKTVLVIVMWYCSDSVSSVVYLDPEDIRWV